MGNYFFLYAFMPLSLSLIFPLTLLTLLKFYPSDGRVLTWGVWTPRDTHMDYTDIVAYRPDAGQRPLNGLQLQPLLCNRRINKHIPRLQLDNHVPETTDAHAREEVLLDYNNGNGVFFVVRAEIHSQSSSGVQSSEVTWSIWLVNERIQLAVQLKVNLWREY
jgi:hypothetical protein